jgi:hypothetical protein
MLKKVKFSKLGLVIFLTILIWVWADRALDETRPIYNAAIVISRTKPNLWVSFPQGSSIDVNEIVLKGAASQINSFEQEITNNPRKLEFTLVVEEFNLDKPGTHTVPVKDIIKQSSWIEKSGLSIVKCDPCEVHVNTVALSQKPLDVQCFDEDEMPRNLETPQQVSMYVPTDWRGTARVDLKSDEVQRAIKQPIAKKPYIRLPNGQPKIADTTVEIKLSPQENNLEPMKVKNVTVGYSLSENILKGHYQIDITNMQDILNFDILATQAAKEAYEGQLFQVEVEVYDKDLETMKKDKIVRREVYYKFPEEFVRSNQIKLAQEKPADAQFTITPAQPAGSAPAP